MSGKIATLVFVGLLSAKSLPISQFPEISPPRVIVFITFPGASADVLVKSTLIPLERARGDLEPGSIGYVDATALRGRDAAPACRFVGPDLRLRTAAL